MAGEAVIIDGVRTPRGRGKATGSLHEIHPQELLAQVLTALASRTGIEPGEVEDVVMGNGSHAGDHANDIARMAVLAAGWPIEVPGVTLNRFCGSGQQAVMFAAMGIAAGWQHLVVAGGVESMSRFGRGLGAPLDGGNQRLRERYPLVPQGISADLIATLEGFGRPDVDAFAVRSQDRAAQAIAADRFARSLVPVHHDRLPGPGPRGEPVPALPPSFAGTGSEIREPEGLSFDQMCSRTYPQAPEISHVHHAGNSSGVVDGAAALLLSSAEYARAHGLTPRARVVAGAVAG